MSRPALSRWSFPLIVVAYLVILKSGELLIGGDIDADDRMSGLDSMLRALTGPIAISMLFVVGVSTWLGWRTGIIREPVRVRKWLWFIPVTYLVVSLAMTDWANLAGQQIGFLVAFTLTMLLVGFTEEVMFRGIGVVTLRRGGFTEVKVALFTSLIFGAAHLTNAINSGSSAISQAVIVTFMGYFLYLSRRVSGAIWIPILLHALWDFSLLSGELGADGEAHSLTQLAIPAEVVIGLVVLWRRKKIEPEGSPA
ncbi:MAG: CPBP family intramembrane metalloprotease [Solirubrobacterales bacterium]|nr:CPBP family intramembrane metalloprotease [Solirubrobacterales bacterium]